MSQLLVVYWGSFDWWEDGYEYVVDNHLEKLNLLLEASDRWYKGMDNVLKRLSGLREGMRGVASNSNELHMLS